MKSRMAKTNKPRATLSYQHTFRINLKLQTLTQLTCFPWLARSPQQIPAMPQVTYSKEPNNNIGHLAMRHRHGHGTRDMATDMGMANEATIFNNELAIEIAVVALRDKSSSSDSSSCLWFQDYERWNYYLLIGRHVSAAFVILARVQLLTLTSRLCIVTTEWQIRSLVQLLCDSFIQIAIE